VSGIEDVVNSPFYSRTDEQINDMAFKELRPKTKRKMKDYLLKNRREITKVPSRINSGMSFILNHYSCTKI
jgi:hypothetical protein